MAAYNGSEYVVEQIASILPQLAEGDELVVVDDASRDDTVARIEAIGDPRIVLHRSEHNGGYVRTFERALQAASGEILMLSDQDDIWPEGRVDAMADALERSETVAGNLVLYPSGAPLRSPLTGREWRLRPSDSRRTVWNRVRILAGDMPYYGCAMAFRRDFRPAVLPFPSYLHESHDLWLALLGNAAGSMTHLESVTVLRRLHDANASPSKPRGVRAVIGSRWMLLRALVTSAGRVRAWRRANAG